jgi:hypothetical protein
MDSFAKRFIRGGAFPLIISPVSIVFGMGVVVIGNIFSIRTGKG